MASFFVISTSRAVSEMSGRVLGGRGLGFRQLVARKSAVAEALCVGGEGNHMRPTGRLLREGLRCVMGSGMRKVAVAFNFSCSF